MTKLIVANCNTATAPTNIYVVLDVKSEGEGLECNIMG